MAAVHFSTNYDHASRETTADGFCVGSAMIGAAAGALAGVLATAGSTFEYTQVLVGTAGVVIGSVVAGTVGRHLVFPIWAALSGRGTRR